MKRETLVTPLTPPFTWSHRSLREFPLLLYQKYKQIHQIAILLQHFQLYQSCDEADVGQMVQCCRILLKFCLF